MPSYLTPLAIISRWNAAEESMRAHEALIAWTPAHLDGEQTAGTVKVGPLINEDGRDWTTPFLMTGGAAEVARRAFRGDISVAQLFIDFHTIVVRDGVDPKKAHEAFLVIDEYRQKISPDIPGAEQNE